MPGLPDFLRPEENPTPNYTASLGPYIDYPMPTEAQAAASQAPVASIIGQIAKGLYDIPGKVMQASEQARTEGIYNPAPVMGELAPNLMGARFPFAKPGEFGLLGGRGVQAAAPEAITTPARVSTRLPSSASGEDQFAPDRLSIDTDVMRRNPDLHAYNVGLVRAYPNVLLRATRLPPDELAEHFMQHGEDNLLHIYNQIPPEIRQRSALWYDGANRMGTIELPERYGTHPNSSTASIAVLSPQNPWDTNASLAYRVHDIHFNAANERYSPEMAELAQQIYAPKLTPSGKLNDTLWQRNQRIAGKKYSEIDDPSDKAAWLRLYDQAHVDRSYPIITPEGYAGGPMIAETTGLPAKAAWKDNEAIARSIMAIQANGDLNKISPLLGEQHKVRSFYNNMIDPNSPHGDVTIDTHAVAAALLRPLSGTSLEVSHNFGKGGNPAAHGSDVTGVRGLYPVYADIYRRAAAKAGILPRQMQSITWEAARGLFTDAFKSQGGDDIAKAIWQQYRNGVMSADDARTQIFKAAGGIRPPRWHVPNP